MARKRVEIEVFGRVQRVGYRFYVEDVALKYRLEGYVRNTRRGSVEIVAEGEEDTLCNFISELRKAPPPARVDDIKILWGEPKDEFRRFEIRY